MSIGICGFTIGYDIYDDFPQPLVEGKHVAVIGVEGQRRQFVTTVSHDPSMDVGQDDHVDRLDGQDGYIGGGVAVTEDASVNGNDVDNNGNDNDAKGGDDGSNERDAMAIVAVIAVKVVAVSLS